MASSPARFPGPDLLPTAGMENESSRKPAASQNPPLAFSDSMNVPGMALRLPLLTPADPHPGSKVGVEYTGMPQLQLGIAVTKVEGHQPVI